MALITRQGKGDKLTIQEMDNNLLYLQGKSGGVHTLVKPQTGFSTSNMLTSSSLVNLQVTSGVLLVSPYIPSVAFTSANLFINSPVGSLMLSGGGPTGRPGVGGGGIEIVDYYARIVIYSDNNGVPEDRLFQSSPIDCSSTGIKTAASSSFAFEAGRIYWIGVFAKDTVAISSINKANAMVLGLFDGTTAYSTIIGSSSFAAGAPVTFPDPAPYSENLPFVGIKL